jgi:tape measure domain-containing protein
MIVDTLETVFSLQDRYSDRAQKAVDATRDLARAQDQVTGVGSGDGSNGLPGYLKLAAAELDSTIPALQEFLSVLKTIGLTAIGTGLAFAGFTGYAIGQYAEFDALTTALKVYTGTAAETARQLRRLREVAQAPGLGYAEAIQGSVRLQAIGFDARLAERALLAMGNALSSAGGGKAELDGIILALSQIVSKGTISAEEINQITERLPQFRDVLKKTFGTADSEALQKSGIQVEQFIKRVIDALEKLPKAAGSAQTTLENVGDTWDRIVVQFGRSSARALFPALNDLERFGSFLERNDVIGTMVDRLYKSASAGSEFANTLRDAASTVVTLGEGVADAAAKADHLGAGLQTALKELGDLVSMPVGFLSEAKDFGDFLVRGASLAVVTLGHIPGIFDAAMTIVDERIVAIQEFLNNVIDIINGIIGMLNKGTSVTLFGQEVGRIGGNGPNDQIPLLQRILRENSGAPREQTPGEKRLTDIIAQLVGEAGQLYDAFNRDKPGSELAGDKSKGSIRGGGVRNAVDATEANTQALDRNTRTQERLIDLNRQLFGGGSFVESATSELAIARHTGRTGYGDPDLQQAMESLARYARRATSGLHEANGRRMREAGAV